MWSTRSGKLKHAICAALEHAVFGLHLNPDDVRKIPDPRDGRSETVLAKLGLTQDNVVVMFDPVWSNTRRTRLEVWSACWAMFCWESVCQLWMFVGCCRGMQACSFCLCIFQSQSGCKDRKKTLCKLHLQIVAPTLVAFLPALSICQP